jgi:uncharacterized protein (DUF1015 family)
MADVQPFRAVRYSGAAGSLADLVAPPYDAVSDRERDELYRRSPYNVLHLTLPGSAAKAARRYREWVREGILVEESEPAAWLLAQRHGDHERVGLVVSLEAEPYSAGVVLPHERTRERVRDERLELLRATGVQLEPIFLLVDGSLGVELPEHEPEIEVDGTRAWRLSEGDLAALGHARQFLIADGHHRYESAVAYDAEEGGEAPRVMALVVSAQDPALEALPTHRVFSRRPELRDLREGEEAPDLDEALARLSSEPYSHSAVVAYRPGRVELVVGSEGELDVELVDRHGLVGISYASRVEDAVVPVDHGEADAAYLVRRPRIQDVFTAARNGRLMPPKSTYFVPKPLSGLLFYPLPS